MERAGHSVSLLLLRGAFTSQHYPELFAGAGTHDGERPDRQSNCSHTSSWPPDRNRRERASEELWRKHSSRNRRDD